jgi:hypothetical protein
VSSEIDSSKTLAQRWRCNSALRAQRSLRGNWPYDVDTRNRTQFPQLLKQLWNKVLVSGPETAGNHDFQERHILATTRGE